MKLPDTINKSLYPQTLQGIRVHLDTLEAVRYYSISITRKKEQLLPGPVGTSVSCISPEELKKDLPAIIVFTGKGILTRDLLPATEDSLQAFERLFPGTPPDDFYIECNASETEKRIFVARKNLIDNHLDILLKEGIQILNFHICSKVELVETSFEKYETEYKPALQAISNFFARNYEGLCTHSNLISYSKEEYFHSRLFKKSVKVLPALFLVVLLVNYFFFDHYWEQKNKLEINAGNIIALREKTTEMENQRIISLKMLKDRGIGEPSCKSFITDRLIAGIPEGVTLSEFIVNPSRMHGNPPTALKTEESKILISGSSRDNLTLDGWIRKLKKNALLRDVVLSNLTGEKDKQKNRFLITAILHPL